MTEQSKCQNCGEVFDDDELKIIEDFHQRVAPGEPCPSGECPECGAVCHPFPKELSSGDKFIATIARMKTVAEFGDDSPPFEDWMETLDNLIAEAREITGIETPEPQDGDSPEPGAGMEILTCDDCGVALEEGRIGKCDDCMADVECDCADRSWYGEVHDTACPLAGQPNAGSLVVKKAISITDEKFTGALDELLNAALKLTFPFLTKHNVSDIVAEVKRHFHTHFSTELSVINGVLPNDEVDLANQTVLGLRDSFKALRRK